MKIRSKLILTPLLLCTLGCSGFLDEEVRSQVLTENFYKTESDARAALVGVYDAISAFGLYNNAMWWMGDLSSDDSSPGPGVNNTNILQIELYTHGALNDRIELLYQGSYIGINRANSVIARIPDVAGVSEVNRKQIVAQAKFLRALLYFNLVRFFGDVPMPTTESTSLDGIKLSRQAAADVYALIVKDLTEAAPDLPATWAGVNVGRATSGSANALLAKVYLTRKDWKGAAEAAKKVTDSKAYSLLPVYADVFDVTKKNHVESVFDAQFKANLGADASQLTLFTGPNQSQQINPKIYTGLNSSYLPEPTFADTTKSWRRGDQRVKTTFMHNFTYGGRTTRLSRVHIGKYIDFSALASNFREANNNFPIIRYADVLLTYAEALAEQGQNAEAITYLNQVRRRGFGLPVATASTRTDFPTADDRTKAWTLTQAIWEERRWELAFEGQRWFDLVRTGRLVDVMRAQGNKNIQDYHVLFPIPQREIDVNPAIKQNQGYN
jgi:starch-binding outer membrane protein, SusD/RagB family